MSLINTYPTVAILLSNYNGFPYLHTSLEGICNQTHPADEIIIIDDGSTDNSLETIREYSNLNSNIKILINEENKGLIYSINRALNESKSDYIVWAASDDYLTPYFLEQSLKTLKDYPGAGICFSQFAVFVDGTTQKRFYSQHGMGAAFDLGEHPHFLTPAMFYERLQRSYMWMSGNTILARRDALLEMGGFLNSLRWHADWFAFLAVAIRYGVCIVPEVLTFMRELPKSYSRTGIKDKKQATEVLKSILMLSENKKFEYVKPFFKNCPYLFTPFGNHIFFVMIKTKEFSLAYKYFRIRIKNVCFKQFFLRKAKQYYELSLSTFVCFKQLFLYKAKKCCEKFFNLSRESNKAPENVFKVVK